MQMPLQITMHNMARSVALEARIREHAAALERLHPRIASCRVSIAPAPGDTPPARIFEVAVEVRVPGQVLVARRRDEDVYAALRDAAADVTVQLQAMPRERRAHPGAALARAR